MSAENMLHGNKGCLMMGLVTSYKYLPSKLMDTGRCLMALIEQRSDLMW